MNTYTLFKSLKYVSVPRFQANRSLLIRKEGLWFLFNKYWSLLNNSIIIDIRTKSKHRFTILFRFLQFFWKIVFNKSFWISRVLSCAWISVNLILLYVSTMQIIFKICKNYQFSYLMNSGNFHSFNSFRVFFKRN